MEKLISSSGECDKIEVVKTTKYWVHTTQGVLLDLQMGNTAFTFGYDDPELIKAVSHNDIRFVRNGEGETSDAIANVVSRLLVTSDMAALTWTVSGTDAVETALSVGDFYWSRVNATKTKIVSLVPCYHGASWLTRSLRKSVVNPICKYVQAPLWSDVAQRAEQEAQTLQQIEEQFSDGDVGRFIVEAIPWVAGVHPFSDSFWKEASALCKKYQVLFVLDDVAGCFGKTGAPYTHKTMGIDADVVALGKSISGGYSPIGVVLISHQVFAQIGASTWDHTYTYNPNTTGVKAIQAVLDKVDAGVMDNIDLIHNQVNEIFDECGVQYRGQGLMYDVRCDLKQDYQRFKDAGFAFNAYNTTSIPVIIPLIADAEYFDALRSRLKKIYV